MLLFCVVGDDPFRQETGCVLADQPCTSMRSSPSTTLLYPTERNLRQPSRKLAASGKVMRPGRHAGGGDLQLFV